MLAASAVQRPLDAEVERFVLLREDGSADDVLALTFRNSTDSEVPLAEGCFDFEYHDNTTEFITARDWGGREIVKDAKDSLRAERVVRVPAEGTVPARETRTLAVHVHHRDLAWRVDQAGALMLKDPLYARALPTLPVSGVRYRATIVFPASPFRREIVADGAQITSRTASWEWGTAVAIGDNLQMRAQQQRGAVVSAPRRLDDAIAEVYRLLFGSPIWAWPETEHLRELLRHPAIAPKIGSAGELPDEKTLVEMPHRECAELYRALLSRLLEVRKAILAEGGAEVVTAQGTEERAERLFRRAEKLHGESGVTAPFPRDAGEALIEVLHYQARLRERPRRWPDKLDEAEFHQHVEEILSARRPPPGSEVPLSAGRLDLLLGETPLELKVADLKGRPKEKVVAYHAQAAEYAVARGKGLAILLVLDEYIYPEGGLGPPGLDEQCPVGIVSTQPGASGAPSHVVVITVVVLARLVRPSKLRSPTKGKERPVTPARSRGKDRSTPSPTRRRGGGSGTGRTKTKR